MTVIVSKGQLLGGTWVCDFLEEGKRCITSRQDIKLAVGRGWKIEEREGKEGASMSKTEGDSMPYS